MATKEACPRRWLVLCSLLAGSVIMCTDAQSVVSVGCFNVPSNHESRTSAPQAVQGTLTPASCIDACSQSDANGFALIKAGECRCATSLPSSISKVSDGMCDSACPEVEHFWCGSASNENLFNVYSIVVGELHSGDTAYLGCFPDSSPLDPRVDEHPLELKRNSHMKDECIAHCSDNNMPFAAITRRSGQQSNSAFAFFSLITDYYCRCGNAYGSSPRALDSYCPGSIRSQPCTLFECFTQMFTDGEHYSVFTTVQHPDHIGYCGDPSPSGAPHKAKKIGKGHYEGDRVRYECSPGYYIRGSNILVRSRTLTCFSNGSWSGAPPSCSAVTCTRPGSPPNVRSVTMNDLYGLLIFTARIRYTCPDNYRLVVNGAFHSEPSYTTICGVNGLWNGSVPECRKEACTVPSPPLHGAILPPVVSVVEPGASIYYSCDCGYDMRGKRRRTCLNGAWFPEEPVCSKRTCPPRFAPKHGMISGNSSAIEYAGTWYRIWKAEEIAYYKCSNDSQIVGSSVSVCLINGTWSSKPPTCEKIHVLFGLTPPVIDDARASNITQVPGGGRFVAPCPARGTPQPQVAWTKLAGGAPQAVSESRAVVLANGSLMFFDFGDEDAGKYECTAYNGIGINATKFYVFELGVAPIIFAVKTRVFQRSGSLVRMHCQAFGYPPPSITWSHNGKTEDPRWLKAGEGGSELIIESSEISDSGKYKCIATNVINGQLYINSSIIQLDVAVCPGLPEATRQRIINGFVLRSANASWTAMLWNSTGERIRKVLCGAVIIKRMYVLTAAHCVYEITRNGRVGAQYTIKMGTRKPYNSALPSVNRAIEQVYIHPKYNHSTSDYDIALIRLGRPIEFQQGRIEAVTIPRPGTTDMCNELESSAYLTAGWGVRQNENPLAISFNSRVLRGLYMPVVTQDTCKTAYRNLLVSDNMICAGTGAGGSDTCRGDSGGPATAYDAHSGKWLLMGLISWGDAQCAKVGTYTVFTRMSNFHAWVKDTIAQDRVAPTPSCSLGRK